MLKQIKIISFFLDTNKSKLSWSKLQFQRRAKLSTTCYFLDSSDDKTPSKGGSGSGGKKGQLCCPKCGEPCTHVETFVCKYSIMLCTFLVFMKCIIILNAVWLRLQSGITSEKLIDVLEWP